MAIVKELKYAEFAFLEDGTFAVRVFHNPVLKGNSKVTREDILRDERTFVEVVHLNKVYAFALMRFIIRIAQRNWFRKKKK